VLSLLEKGCSAINGIGTLRNVQRKHSLLLQFRFCVDANREARKAQPLGLSACCLALLSECACSVCARLHDFFALMYFIVDTIGELDSVARLNSVCIGLTSAIHALSAFYASGPLMADHSGMGNLWLAYVLSLTVDHFDLSRF
jgi:hypothetical protein